MSDGIEIKAIDPNNYQVGQRLWAQKTERYGTSGWLTVASVGRKWVNLQNESGYAAGRVEKGERYLDGGVYSSHARLYASPESYEEEAETNQHWTDFHRAVSRTYRRPEHLDKVMIDKLFSYIHGEKP